MFLYPWMHLQGWTYESLWRVTKFQLFLFLEWVQCVHNVRKECMTESISTQNIRRGSAKLVYARSAKMSARSAWQSFQAHKLRRSSMVLAIEERSRKEWKIIHKGVECGREPIVKCARVEISTNCRSKCSEEQEKVEEVKVRRETEYFLGEKSLKFS